MLGNRDAIATIAVKDIEVASKFYGGTLGLKPADKQEPGTLAYKSGNSTIFVYESRYAGTNKATAVTWPVGDDVEAVVQSLKAKGVAFEHYDLPNTTRKGDVHLAGKVRVAWFKDPDGNIHSIVNG
jgi:catechol 2,3-dioxygenase-like lactoylglutathione lyase family enzyme